MRADTETGGPHDGESFQGFVDSFLGGIHVRERIERNPAAYIGGAFGLGYVLGGGRVGAVLAGAGLKVVRRELLRIAEGAMRTVRSD